MATKPICSISGCNKPRLVQERCSTHYSQMFRSGKMVRIYAPHHAGEGFLEAALLTETDDCILWPFGKSSTGYGELGTLGTHTIVCRRAHGDPPEGKPLACHSCGRHACINKKHLRWGSHQDNADDAVTHGVVLQGEAHPNAKLTENQARQILAADRSIGHTALARELGVSVDCVTSVRRGKTWRHLT